MHAAIPMLGLHVLNPQLLDLEVTVTFLAVMVTATRYEVFLQCAGAPKFDVAVLANPVGFGIVFVLLQGVFASE